MNLCGAQLSALLLRGIAEAVTTNGAKSIEISQYTNSAENHLFPRHCTLETRVTK